MKTTIINVAIICLCVVVCLYVWLNYRSRQNQMGINYEVQHIYTVLSSIADREMLQYRLEGQELKGDSTLLDDLRARSQQTPILVFRFGDTSCDLCYNHALLQMCAFNALVDNSRVIAIVNFQDLKMVDGLKQMYRDKFQYINIEYGTRLYLEKPQETLQPYFFVLENGSLSPKNLFFYVKESPELNEKYFTFIASHYFGSVADVLDGAVQ